MPQACCSAPLLWSQDAKFHPGPTRTGSHLPKTFPFEIEEYLVTGIKASTYHPWPPLITYSSPTMTAKWWFFSFHHSQLFISTHSTLTCLPTSAWTHGFYSLGGNLSTSFLTLLLKFSSVQSLCCVRLFATPWAAARQASLSITNSWSLLKLKSIESVMPSNPSHPLWSPSPPTVNLSQHQGLFKWVSSSHLVAKVLEFRLPHPMNIQDWFSSGWIGWISLQSKRLSRVFSNTTVQKHQFFSAQLSFQSNCHIHIWPLEKP